MDLKVFMHDDEIPFLFDNIPEESTVLEWGSGGSTIALAKCNKVKNLVSIEHDETWHHKISDNIKKDNLEDKVTYLFCCPGYPYSWANNGDGSLTQFYNYINAPFILDTKFDVIIIDGRARPYCAQIAPMVSKSVDTKVFIHDYNLAYEGRSHYSLALESLVMQEVRHDMALFKPKQECLVKTTLTYRM